MTDEKRPKTSKKRGGVKPRSNRGSPPKKVNGVLKTPTKKTTGRPRTRKTTSRKKGKHMNLNEKINIALVNQQTLGKAAAQQAEVLKGILTELNEGQTMLRQLNEAQPVNEQIRTHVLGQIEEKKRQAEEEAAREREHNSPEAIAAREQEAQRLRAEEEAEVRLLQDARAAVDLAKKSSEALLAVVHKRNNSQVSPPLVVPTLT
ncbi:MAG: hypothetical protein AAB340_02955 [Patescibacteria group bacterium]